MRILRGHLHPDSHLASQHDICGSLDPVNKRLPAAVQIVKLGLGHGVVDVDGGHLQLVVLEHLVEVVDSGGGLLRQTLDARQVLGILLVDEVGEVTTIVEDHVEWLAVREDDGLLDAPDVLLVSLALPGVHWDSTGSHGGSGVILNIIKLMKDKQVTKTSPGWRRYYRNSM